MVKVLVHGNPETEAIWGRLVASLTAQGLDDHVVLLSPPGFGAPAPEGWGPTRAAYVEWLADRLGSVAGPVDLVGHDWGAGHVYGLLAEQPDLVRSWAADCAGLLHADYVWHENAQIWQTPGAGEEALAAMAGVGVEGRRQAYEDRHVHPEAARAMAEAFDDDMARCILGLYRDAAQPVMAELGQQLTSGDLPPGLVIDPTDDPFVSSELAAKMVEPLGADHLRLDGRGHWWMSESPDLAASGLLRFWRQLDHRDAGG